jgi:hypothetical protein
MAAQMLVALLKALVCSFSKMLAVFSDVTALLKGEREAPRAARTLLGRQRRSALDQLIRTLRKRIGGLAVALELESEVLQVLVRHLLQVLILLLKLMKLGVGNLPPVCGRSRARRLFFRFHALSVVSYLRVSTRSANGDEGLSVVKLALLGAPHDGYTETFINR